MTRPRAADEALSTTAAVSHETAPHESAPHETASLESTMPSLEHSAVARPALPSAMPRATVPLNATAIAYPLTLYYDDSCPLCRAEMAAITRVDHAGRIRLVDCSGPGFDDPDCRAAGIATRDLMHRLHARDAEGRWAVGVPAVSAAYRAVGLAGLGGFFARPGLQPALRRLYGWLADHRQGLSRLGLTGLFSRYVDWLARRAVHRSSACHEGTCTLPHR